MYHTSSSGHQTTSWLHEEVERMLRRCCQQVLAETLVEPTGGRPAVLPDLSLWMGVTVGTLRRLSSQRAVWRLLAGGQLWEEPCYDICDQAVYNRLDTYGSGPLPKLFDRVTQLLMEWLTPVLQKYEEQTGMLAPFAGDVVAIDETTLDAVCRRVQGLRKVPAGDDRLLPGKLVTVFDIRRQLWRAIQLVEQVHENEKLHIIQILLGIPTGTLLLFDLGYFSFALFDALTEGNYPWVTRLRALTTGTVMHTYYDDGDNWDRLMWLGIWDTQASYLMRVIQVTHAGVRRQYLTNVLNPQVLSIADLVSLYARRWDIERAFLLLKKWLGLSRLWSSKPQVIMAQVWAGVILAQVLQAVRVQLAATAEVEIFDISMQLLMESLGHCDLSREDGWQHMAQQARHLGIIRPNSRRNFQVPAIALSAYQPLPEIRTLVRRGLYPEVCLGLQEVDEPTRQIRVAISQQRREQQVEKRAQERQEKKEMEATIRAEVKKAMEEKKQEGKKQKKQKTEEEIEAEKKKKQENREKREKEEYEKWEAYWKREAPPGLETPPWNFYVPWYKEGLHVKGR